MLMRRGVCWDCRWSGTASRGVRRITVECGTRYITALLCDRVACANEAIITVCFVNEKSFWNRLQENLFCNESVSAS